MYRLATCFWVSICTALPQGLSGAPKLKGKLACNKTFLLNKDNEIVLVGEPFGREKITKLYQKYIGSLNIEYHDSVAE